MINQCNTISLDIQRHQDTLVVNMKPSGRPSSKDFKKLSGMLETAVYAIQSPKISLFVDLSELKGLSARSAWNELLHGLKIGSEFDRIAIYGQNRWHKLMINTFSWLISPNLKVFKRKEDATSWVMAS